MGLLLHKWLDVPVIVAANVLIDVEVLADHYIQPGWPVHQLWHFHTLLVGGLAGAIFGAIIYYVKPLRRCSEKIMSLIGLPGKATLLSMVLAGLLGAWLHVFIDSCYHHDVQIFWPYLKNSVWRWLQLHRLSKHFSIQQQVEFACLIFWGLMAGLYVFLVVSRRKKSKSKPVISA